MVYLYEKWDLGFFFSIIIMYTYIVYYKYIYINTQAHRYKTRCCYYSFRVWLNTRLRRTEQHNDRRENNARPPRFTVVDEGWGVEGKKLNSEARTRLPAKAKANYHEEPVGGGGARRGQRRLRRIVFGDFNGY